MSRSPPPRREDGRVPTERSSTDAALHHLQDLELADAVDVVHLDRSLPLPTNIGERLIGWLSAASRP